MTTDEPGGAAPAPAPLRPRIAIVGPAAAGKRSLVAGLTGRAVAPVVAASSAAAAAATTTTTPHRIDTKYYTAAVDLVCVRVGGGNGNRGGGGAATATTTTPPPGAAAAADQASPHPAVAAAEAVVLVFDGGDEASFEAARAWVTAAGPALDGAAIRLAVANKADVLGLHAEGVPPAWRASAASWAADAGWEWVDAALGGTGGAAVEAALAADAGESVGLARVREALEAHMWPGLERKPAGDGRERHGRGVQPSSGGAPLLPPRPPSDDGDADDADADATTFEALMAEAAAARDRIRALPDAERRAAAAAMASRLLAALEVEGGEEEEEEEGEEEG